MIFRLMVLNDYVEKNGLQGCLTRMRTWVLIQVTLKCQRTYLITDLTLQETILNIPVKLVAFLLDLIIDPLEQLLYLYNTYSLNFTWSILLTNFFLLKIVNFMRCSIIPSSRFVSFSNSILIPILTEMPLPVPIFLMVKVVNIL